jgi:hypothetical protein
MAFVVNCQTFHTTSALVGAFTATQTPRSTFNTSLLVTSRRQARAVLDVLICWANEAEKFFLRSNHKVVLRDVVEGISTAVSLSTFVEFSISVG